jgi:hypothetical protein
MSNLDYYARLLQRVREVSCNSISLLELILSAKHELRDYIRLQPNGPELLECLNQIEPYVKARNTHYTLSRGQPGSNKRKSSPNEVQPRTERKRARRRARTPKNGSATQGRPAKTCLECGRTETHQWRSGPQGMSTLCNACGMRYSRSLKKKPTTAGEESDCDTRSPLGSPRAPESSAADRMAVRWLLNDDPPGF